MIIVRVVGGMANQMGCYAAALSLAQKHKTPIKIDLAGLKNDRQRKFDLDKLMVDISIASEDEIKKVSRQSSIRMINRLKKSLYKRLGTQDPNIYREKSLYYDPGFYDMPSDVYVMGNFLSTRYYESVFPLLKQIYRVSAPLSSETQRWHERIAGAQHAVALHVRRTDYVNNPKTIATHGITSLGYYDQATKYILERAPGAEFFVFSDDPQWVKENITTGTTTHYIDCNDASNGYQDFHLMKACRHYIMANSGFSRWAALLSENDQGIIIRPESWMASDIIDDADVGPASWLKM